MARRRYEDEDEDESLFDDERPDVPSYLVPAILTTLLCCLPFGVVSLVYAAQVDSRLATGDYRGAVASSAAAKKWAWVSFWCSVVPVGIYVAVIIGVIAAGGFK